MASCRGLKLEGMFMPRMFRFIWESPRKSRRELFRGSTRTQTGVPHRGRICSLTDMYDAA